MKKLVALLLVAMMFISGTALAEFPLTTEPVTLKFLSRTPSFYPGQDFENVDNMKAYEQMTGINIEYDNYDPSVFSNTLAGVIASGDLPDVIFRGNLSNVQLYEWGSQGFLVDLTPYLEEYAPNFTALMEKYPDIRMTITAPDGAIYGLPQAVIAPEMRVPTKMFINKNALEQYGKGQPTTMDELYDLLVSIRDGDMNGNGVADEMPLVGDIASMYKLIGGAYNLRNRGNHHNIVDVDPETNELRIWGIDDDAREMLVYLNKLYTEKLMDPEIFTNKTNTAGALATADALGIVLHTTASMISNEKINDYVGLKQPIVGPDGTGYFNDVRSNLHSTGNYCVTTACENIELAVQWVDYFYGDNEGSRFMLVGQEGINWEIKEDGKGYWTDECAARRTDDMSQDAFISLFAMWPGGRVPAAFYSDMWGGEYSDEPAATAKSMINYIIPTVWPIFSWTEEENEVVSTVESDIKSFINNFFAQAVAGEVELTDDVWNDFVANVNSMGADELLGAYQTAVERIYAGGAY